MFKRTLSVAIAAVVILQAAQGATGVAVALDADRGSAYSGALLAAAEPTVTHPSGVRVGIVRTQAAAGTRDYLSGTPLNTHYDFRVDQVKRLLDSHGFVSAYVNDADLASLATLKQFDVLVFTMTLATTPAQRTAIRAYASEGGGIVGSFALSRWDADPSYRFGYLPFLGMHGHPGVYTWPPSSAALKPWEWGEISEIYNVKFRNDPLISGPYHLEPTGSHWILTNGFSTGESRLLVDKPNRYNEIIYTMPGMRNVTPLYRYNTLVNGTPADDAESGHLAGWTAEYYFGRFVYFGFHMHDLISEGWAADARTASVARRVLVNSVRWAGSPGGYTHLRKAVEMTGSAWYTRATLYVDQTVRNTGGVSLRGPLRIEVRDPAGTLVYSGQAYNNLCPLPPGWSYTHKSYTVPLQNPRVGTWSIRMSYQFFDYFRNGWVGAERMLHIESSGSRMSGARLGQQTLVGAGNRPVIGTRLAGTDRYETSVRLSRQGWPTGVADSRSVVLATGTDYPDALAAAPLAGALDAPVLLVPRTALTAGISAELRRLFNGRASGVLVVVGGEGAVPSAVVGEAVRSLSAAGVAVTVDRIAGNDRFGTARAIAERVGTPSEGAFARTAFVVSGQNYPDALAIGSLAAAARVPILPVRAGKIPADIQAALKTLRVEHVTIIGGTAAVGATVEEWLESAGHRVPGVPDGAMNVNTRLAGSGRYETGLLAADFGVALSGMDDANLYFVTGRNWPDALALGPVAGKAGRMVVLIDGEEIGGSDPVADYLVGRRGDQLSCTFVGGPSAISDYVRGQVRIALGR